VVVLYRLEDLAGEVSDGLQQQQPLQKQPRASALRTNCSHSSTTLITAKPDCIAKRQGFLDFASEIVLHAGEEKGVVEHTAAKLQCYYVS